MPTNFFLCVLGCISLRLGTLLISYVLGAHNFTKCRGWLQSRIFSLISHPIWPLLGGFFPSLSAFVAGESTFIVPTSARELLGEWNHKERSLKVFVQMTRALRWKWSNLNSIGVLHSDNLSHGVESAGEESQTLILTVSNTVWRCSLNRGPDQLKLSDVNTSRWLQWILTFKPQTQNNKYLELSCFGCFHPLQSVLSCLPEVVYCIWLNRK